MEEKKTNGEKIKNLKNTFVQFMKFNIVGVSNTLVDFGVYFLLTHLGMDYMWAQVCSYTAGIVNSYIWNTLWTFKKEKKRDAREIVMFLIVNLISMGVSLGVLELTKGVMKIESELICKCAASFCSAMVNFALNKLFVFKDKKEAGDGSEKKE